MNKIKGIIQAKDGYEVVTKHKIGVKDSDEVHEYVIRYKVICFGICEEDDDITTVQPFVMEKENGYGLMPVSELSVDSYELLYKEKNCNGEAQKAPW